MAGALKVDEIAAALKKLSHEELAAIAVQMEQARAERLREAEAKARELQEKQRRLYEFVTKELGTTIEELGLMPVTKQVKAGGGDARPLRHGKERIVPKLVLKADPNVFWGIGRVPKGGQGKDGRLDSSLWREVTPADLERWRNLYS